MLKEQTIITRCKKVAKQLRDVLTKNKIKDIVILYHEPLSTEERIAEIEDVVAILAKERPSAGDLIAQGWSEGPERDPKIIKFLDRVKNRKEEKDGVRSKAGWRK